MADFIPKFVDLVRNYTTTVGTGDFALGSAVNGFTGFASVLQPGDQFYYSCLGVDKPAEREVGRGTLTADGKIVRAPVSGTKTSFTTGTKAIALVAAAEWFASVNAGNASGVKSVATRAALAASATTVPLYLSEAGREGQFSWIAGDPGVNQTVECKRVEPTEGEGGGRRDHGRAARAEARERD